MARVIFTRSSKNVKTGPIPVSYSESKTCPDACELKKSGCYAESGNTAIHWRKLDKGEWGISWDQFCKEVSILPKKQFWRKNVAGDLPGNNNRIDNELLSQLVDANKKANARGFTFTHKPVGWGNIAEVMNMNAVYSANKNGFTINLSADNMQKADELYNLGIAPVVVVVPSDSPRHMKTPEGRHVSVCPATEVDDMSCDKCQLCQKVDRKIIIAFRSHGSGKSKIDNKFKLNVVQ